MKVLLRAPLLTNSGYGVHSRQVFEWLLEKNVDFDVECLKWGHTPWLLNDKSHGGIIKEIMERSKALEPPYDVTIQLQLPDEWDEKLGKFNVGMSAFVETDKCNPKWVECCNKMDKVIVPSTFTKNVVKRSGILAKKIDVVPEWFNEDVLKSDVKTELPEVDTDYNYLIIGQLTAQDPASDRKNLVQTLSWLFEHHEGDENVGIILKTSMGRGSKKDKIDTEKLIGHIVKYNRKGEFPKVFLVHGNMKKDDVAGLYNNKKVKAFISATRGEGYGLPLVDAAASGVPVIATNWSGHLEFLKNGKFIPLDYEMTPIPESKVDNRIFLKGFAWAQPSRDSFFNCLDEMRKNYSKHKETALTSAEVVVENFSKQNIKKMYDNIFEGII